MSSTTTATFNPRELLTVDNILRASQWLSCMILFSLVASGTNGHYGSYTTSVPVRTGNTFTYQTKTFAASPFTALMAFGVIAWVVLGVYLVLFKLIKFKGFVIPAIAFPIFDGSLAGINIICGIVGAASNYLKMFCDPADAFGLDTSGFGSSLYSTSNSYCDTLRAAVAFAFITAILFLATLFFHFKPLASQQGEAHASPDLEKGAFDESLTPQLGAAGAGDYYAEGQKFDDGVTPVAPVATEQYPVGQPMDISAQQINYAPEEQATAPVAHPVNDKNLL